MMIPMRLDFDRLRLNCRQKCRLKAFFSASDGIIADCFLKFDRMFARFVEHDVRPTFLRQSQIHALGRTR
ncbi:TPA: hypothetical protein ACKMPM_000878 [Neisseria gonorrhoeae]|uniref:Uncharacterized protein n=1 Tax=Neisseria gonorrhoeae TaxID=485 RepID=A0A378VZC2_NEIGO|nr:hypothetical protein BBZ87_00640 [Neisseria gonorrhoeae]OHZ87322.1 hypothetical protein BBZ70_01905 [Neisseria gonorrhoeae]SUA24577.1 Uncharacterised protein [Neisseria gonorrhoeae]